VISCYAESKISFARIQEFLLLTEVKKDMKGPFKQNEDNLAVKI
jgi:hypothetical protein